MRLANGVIEVAGAIAASTGGLSSTIHSSITALPDSPPGVLVLVAVVALFTIVFVWLSRQSQGTESYEGEADTDVNPRRSEYTSENPPSVWTKGEDPTTLGDSRTIEENTTNQSKPDSKSSDETPQTSQETYQFNWEVSTKVSMDDIGGMEEIKQELKSDIVRPLAEKEKARRLGIPLPNLLLHGPPGTGKTYLAKALATELGFPFVKLSGGDLQSKWINESANKINQLFAEARRIAAEEGGAVVFIDEIDSVLKARGNSANTHAEDDKVVNELLNQLESTTEDDVLVIGATNRLDALDEAGIRSGRFDLKIRIGQPDRETRAAIIRAQLADRPHSLTSEHIEALAEATEGAVAADLEAIVIQAARASAFERDDDEIIWGDFQQG